MIACTYVRAAGPGTQKHSTAYSPCLGELKTWLGLAVLCGQTNGKKTGIIDVEPAFFFITFTSRHLTAPL
jgi:hypothetical protein